MRPPNPLPRVLGRAVALGALCLALTGPAWGAQAGARKLLLMGAYGDVQVSSTRNDPDGARFRYAALNVLDGEPRTAWCARENMLGVGEWIEIGLLVSMELSRIDLVGTLPPAPANTPPVGTPLPYNRVHRVRLTNALGEFRNLEFDDTAEPSIQNFKPLAGDRFRLKVESVYPGSERALTCIGEVSFWGRTEPQGAAVDKLAATAIATDVRHVFEEAFGAQRPALAGTRLKTALADLFGRYANYSPIALTRTITAQQIPPALAGPTERPDETACVAALRALHEASAHARRFLRENYFLKKELPLGGGCQIRDDPLFWVLRGREESIPLFWSRGEYFGLLELSDDRAIEPFLAAYREGRAVYHWWDKPAGWHRLSRTPQELIGTLGGPHPGRVLERLVEKHKGEPGYFLDGLRALQATVTR